MANITLGKHSYPVIEPVFKHLRVIMAAQNEIIENSNSNTDAQISALIMVIIKNLLSKRHFLHVRAIGLRKATGDQFTALLANLPELCGMEDQQIQATPPRFSSVDPFDRIYARLGLLFGWSFEYIDNHMTMTRYRAIEEQLQYTPPVDELVAGYLGYKPSTPDEQARALDAMLGL